MSRAPRKYERGETFTDVCSLIIWCASGKWVFAWGKPRHPSIVLNQRAQTLLYCVPNGCFAQAWISREWHDWAMGRSA